MAVWTLAPTDLLGLMTEAKIRSLASSDDEAPLTLNDPLVIAGVLGASKLADADMWGPLANVATKPAVCPEGWCKSILARLARYHMHMIRPDSLITGTESQQITHPVVSDYRSLVGYNGKPGLLDRIGSGDDALPSPLVGLTDAEGDSATGLTVVSNTRVFTGDTYRGFN